MHIFFIVIFGFTILHSYDASYLYQNNKDIIVNISNTPSVKVIRKIDQKVLINTKNRLFYIDKSNGTLDISYKIKEKVGGFDVLYSVKNHTKKPQLMPDFHIPGIKLDINKTVDILNTNTKHYMERREVLELKNMDRNYFSVSSFSQIKNDGLRHEEEMNYASGTLSPYSPVIALKTKEFSIGTSLNYPILKYEDHLKRDRGAHNVLMNKLYPKMRIYKDYKSWRFSYSFNKYGPLKGRIGPMDEYKFKIPVRFSKPKFWLLTLHPYKEYFQKLYPINNSIPKDVSPILMVNFSFYGDSVTAFSKRGWAWRLENIDKNGYSYLPLKDISYGLSGVMKKNGYKRVTFVTFSGVYNANKSPSLFDELPFQFITNLEPNMEREKEESLKIFKKAGQKFGFWWGISGMMPIDKHGNVISFDTWQPHSDTPFIYNNSSHKKYALRQLNKALNIQTDSLSLDAYVRMEENDRIYWLDEMKQRAPKIKFVLEQQVDFMHTFAAIILQPSNPILENSNHAKSILTKPAVFSHYLNPKSEVQVWLMQNSEKKNTAYIQKLVKWGYTPIIMFPSSKFFDHDEKNVTKRILDNSKHFIQVFNLDNSKIATCFDGLDNDKDGKTDWPYDEKCLSASDDSE